MTVLLACDVTITGEFVFTDANSQLTLTNRPAYPNAPGCYAMVRDDGKSLIIGSSMVSVAERVWDYRRPDQRHPLAPRTQLWDYLKECGPGARVLVLTMTTRDRVLPCGVPIPACAEAIRMERALIVYLQPLFNTMGIKSGEITERRRCPKVR